MRIPYGCIHILNFPRIVDNVCLRLPNTAPPPKRGGVVMVVRVYFSSENLLLAYQSYKVKRKVECAHLAFCF